MIKKRLIQFLAHARKHVYLNVFWQWIGLLMQICLVYAVVDCLRDSLVGGVRTEVIGRTVLILLIALLVKVLCEKRSAYHTFEASVDVKRMLRKQIYEKLLRLGANYRDYVSTAQVVQMSAEGVEQLEIYFGRYLPQFFYSMLAPITLFVLLSFQSFRASLVLLICVPLIPLSIVAVQKFAKKLLSKYWGIYTGLGDSFLENLQGLTTLKVYQADGRKAEEMDQEAEHFRKITMKVLLMQLNSISVMDVVAYGGAAVGMLVALHEFAVGHIAYDAALKIILLDFEFFIPLRVLGSFFHIAMNGMAASDRIFAFLDAEEMEKGLERLAEEAVGFELKEVHFSYEENREILKGVSLKIPAGKWVALVGESGSGKSTIAKLLQGKNQGYTGSLLCAGHELREIVEEDLFRRITFVGHESYLFKGTVWDNLQMACPSLTEQDARAVLEKVNLWQFLEQQEGLQTKLLERGSNFSGGQRQRLALARALLKDSACYIFDEATSNIDGESEGLILQLIQELAQSKTVLMIAHRLQSVVKADCIYFLEQGRIKEKGRHEELMALQGSYAHLFAYQKSLEAFGCGFRDGEECDQ